LRDKNIDDGKKIKNGSPFIFDDIETDGASSGGNIGMEDTVNKFYFRRFKRIIDRKVN
jgi:hypothetical protein